MESLYRSPFDISADGSFVSEQHVVTFDANVGVTDANFELR